MPDGRDVCLPRSRLRRCPLWGATALGALLCVVALFVGAPARGEGPARLSLESPASTITVGEEVTVTVRVQEVTNLYGIDLRLGFDPEVLEVVDIDPGKEGAQSTPGRYPYPDLEARNEADNDAGTLWYMVTQLGAREPVSGTGTVVALRLRGRAAGSGAITVNQADLANNEGFMIPVETRDATIAVAEALADGEGDVAVTEAGTSPVGAAAAGAVAVAAAGALVMVWRRRLRRGVAAGGGSAAG